MLNHGGKSSILNNSIYVTEKELRKWKVLAQIKRQQLGQLPQPAA